MFSIFRKKHAHPFRFLKTDLHSHLIPNIDDGSKSVEDSIQMIRQLMELGFEKVVTTPHIMTEYYPNDATTILQGLEKLKAALVDANISFQIEAAAEYYVDESFENLLSTNMPLLTFGEQQVLIEFSMLSEPVNAMDVIFQLKTKGYQPIIAHPERYLYFADKFEIFSQFKSLGCELQINLLSLAGYYGDGQKKLGTKLLKENLVKYLGTDLHRSSQLKYLEKFAATRLFRRIQKMHFHNIEL